MKWLLNLLGLNKPPLEHFYRDYLAWVKAGVPDDACFSRHSGLCGNLNSWGSKHKVGYKHHAKLCAQMVVQFDEAGLDDTFPFGRGAYHMDRMKGRMHLDTNRLHFVRTHAEGPYVR